MLYDFTGFFQPVDMGGVFNKAKAGSAVPVKFSLDGAPVSGSNTPAAGGASPVVTKVASYGIACPTATAQVDTLEETLAASQSGLKYDPAADQWVYVWKTGTSLAGVCQRLECDPRGRQRQDGQVPVHEVGEGTKMSGRAGSLTPSVVHHHQTEERQP